MIGHMWLVAHSVRDIMGELHLRTQTQSKDYKMLRDTN